MPTVCAQHTENGQFFLRPWDTRKSSQRKELLKWVLEIQFLLHGRDIRGRRIIFHRGMTPTVCVFRKEGAVWHDWPCGWAILVGWIQTQWAIRLRDMRRPETYQRAVIQGTFVGLAVGDTMIIFVSPKDYFRKKCARLIRYKTRARWLQGKFLQQPQWESLWQAELTEMG